MFKNVVSNSPVPDEPDALIEHLGDLVTISIPDAGEVVLAMLLSLALNLFIALVYRLTYRGSRYSQDFVQTLIMIGMVTTILIMVVSGNGAVAFGMFAAFSVIRFRRNLGQSRDLGFVFFAMAIGMVVGARFYAMAVIITVIVNLAIYLLTRFDAFAPRKASHLINIRVSADVNFEDSFKEIFEHFAEKSDLLRVSSVQAGMMTELRYGVQTKADANMSEFLESLQQACGNNRVVIVPTGREFDA
ncbi:DUF4956 domain-containing protein [Roseibacillus persicicus]|uniref:DUF4956 domain-containing protein n=1 Tax=Roseibacillus persicicus TaxID=454148 RepID=UPI00280CAA7C|nr:DUF4956 domain-containing protein [Roseibacillus persicicus]MDQ8192320.1 DUF4956 domain-containing protein [Roseibacillus persicicus]